MRNNFVIASTLLVGAALLTSALLTYAIHAQVLKANIDVANTGEVPVIADVPEGPAVEFIGHSDLLDKLSFAETRVGGLSALTYDPRRDLYYALVDREQGVPARFYTLDLPADSSGLGELEVFDVTILRNADGEPFTASKFDGEGLAFTPWGDLVASSENEPSVRIFSLQGRLLQEIPVPRKFLVAPRGEAPPNGTFEGLSISPSGNVLFVAPQKPLASDTQGPEREQRIRLLRYESRTAEGFRPSGEFFYHARSEGGIAEIAAISETELLILERTNEIFYVDLDAAEDVTSAETLAAPDLEPVQKKLLVALDECMPENTATSPNIFEGMALGPLLPSQRQILMLVSDDNFDDNQTTRLATLSIRTESLADEEREACK